VLLAAVNVSQWIAAVAAIASAFAAIAAWAAVRVAARSAEEDRRRRDLADLRVLHEELLAAPVAITTDPTPDSLEFAYGHVNRAAAVAGHPIPAALDKLKAACWNDIQVDQSPSQYTASCSRVRPDRPILSIVRARSVAKSSPATIEAMRMTASMVGVGTDRCRARSVRNTIE
jgi:hypothetical protein